MMGQETLATRADVLPEQSQQRTVVIVSPHFPPSGLPPAHRARQFARHLPRFGWKPIVLTVDPRYYQEALDEELMNLVADDLEVIRVKAFRPKKPGGWWGLGDLGLRSLLQLYAALKKLCRTRKVDLVYLPCPPNYQMLLGRWIYDKFGVPYVLDYTDPWVCDWIRDARPLSKLWMAYQLSVWLEPVAIRHVRQVVAVSEGTNESVRANNGHLRPDQFTALPYGGESEVFEYLRNHPKPTPALEPRGGKYQLLYLGAMWEAAYGTLDAFLDAVVLLKQRRPELYDKLQVRFIGTTYRPDAVGNEQVMPRATSRGIADAVSEDPRRLPFLDAMRTLVAADGLLILGSCEPHYTASRLMPYVLARRPLMVVFHEASDATAMLRQANAAELVTYGAVAVEQRVEAIQDALVRMLTQPQYDPEKVHWDAVEDYSAEAMSRKLANCFRRALEPPAPSTAARA